MAAAEELETVASNLSNRSKEEEKDLAGWCTLLLQEIRQNSQDIRALQAEVASLKQTVEAIIRPRDQQQHNLSSSPLFFNNNKSMLSLSPSPTVNTTDLYNNRSMLSVSPTPMMMELRDDTSDDNKPRGARAGAEGGFPLLGGSSELSPSNSGHRSPRAGVSRSSWRRQLKMEQVMLATTSSGNKTNGGQQQQPQLKTRIVSWSVLPEEELKKHYEQSYQPNERNALLRNVLKHFCVYLQADLICLQQVDCLHVVKRALEATHDGISTPTGSGFGAPIAVRDSCCVFYNRKKWRLVRKQIVNLNDIAILKCRFPIPQQWSSLSSFQKTFVQNDFGLFVQLERIPEAVQQDDNASAAASRASAALHRPQQIVVATTQLHWDESLEYVKFAQLHYLLEKLYDFVDDIEYNKQNVPVLLAGNLNAPPDSPIYKHLAAGSTNPKAKELLPKNLHPTDLDLDVSALLSQTHAKCTFSLQSAYSHAGDASTGRHRHHGYALPTFTTNNNNTVAGGGFLDHIFYPNASMELLGRLKLPVSSEELQTAYGSAPGAAAATSTGSASPVTTTTAVIPSMSWPSDHLAVGAELLFKHVPQPEVSSPRYCSSSRYYESAYQPRVSSPSSSSYRRPLGKASASWRLA